MLRLGAHMSISGGFDRSLLDGRRIGCEAIQVFTKSSSQWAARALGEEEIVAFRTARASSGIGWVGAHGSYLVNLASPDEALRRRSIDAFRAELERCDRLGIGHLIAHPGAHVGSGEEAGLRRIAAALDEVHECRGSPRAKVLLEITAGQGSTVGHRFEHLARILDLLLEPERVGFCFDTCHAHAAGYDLRTERSYQETFEAFDRQVGIERIEAFHLNDCRREIGSRVDRHWHIGRGFLGPEPFRLLMNDPRFDGLPGILETPKGRDLAEDVVNLRLLRRLVGDTASKRVPTRLREGPVRGGRAGTAGKGKRPRKGKGGLAKGTARARAEGRAGKGRRT